METTKMSEKLASLNLSNFVKNGQGRKTIYNVPAEIVNDEKKMKIFRKNIRREKTSICLKIASEVKETSKISESTLNAFKKFYKENFKVNDYSIESFTSVTETKESYKLYEIALFFVKEQISAKK